MERKPVNSSNVASVGFDKATRTLEIGFHNGGVYQYAGVHPNTHRHLMNAPSKGTFVWKNVRDRFPYQKV